VTAHPAALVLDDHQPVYVSASTKPAAMVRCSCKATVQWCDFATHQTEVLVEAGLLADGQWEHGWRHPAEPGVVITDEARGHRLLNWPPVRRRVSEWQDAT
jgi:hypothetical protein